MAMNHRNSRHFSWLSEFLVATGMDCSTRSEPRSSHQSAKAKLVVMMLAHRSKRCASKLKEPPVRIGNGTNPGSSDN